MFYEKSLGDYAKFLLDWRSNVLEVDRVYHLGHLSHGSDDAILNAMPYLPGHKILIRSDRETLNDGYYHKHGFHFVVDSIILKGVDLSSFRETIQSAVLTRIGEGSI